MQQSPPPGGACTTQAYDGVMQDRRTAAGATSMAYGYAGLTAQATGGTGAHSEMFIRDPDGMLLSTVNTSNPAGVVVSGHYLLNDQQSVMAVITPGGGSATRYLYEPYGEQIRSWTDPNPGTANSIGTETTGNPPSAENNPWRYASGYYDPQTGFLKYGARYYMPSFQTWTQPDPKNGKVKSPFTLNPYIYSASDPVDNRDATGKFWGEGILDEAQSLISTYGGYVSACAVGAGISAEGAAPLAFYASIFGSPEAGLFTERAALVGGCVGGLGLAYLSDDAALDVPTVEP